MPQDSVNDPAASEEAASTAPRRGRPPRTIDRDDVIRAIEKLFAEGGIDAVTIERAAQEISVSRATLYRTVPSKEHLLGMLFVRMTDDLDRRAHAVTSTEDSTPADRLEGLVRVQIEAAVQMRDYLFVYFDATNLPEGIYDNWRHWTQKYEQVWVRTVQDAMDYGTLPPGDPILTTRLILGMTIWVANWFRPEDGYTPTEIADRGLELLGTTVGAAPRRKPRAQQR